MRNTIWNKRIPTLLGIFLIIISVAITSMLVKSGVIFTTKASPSQTPQDIRFTNITDTSFTITYATDDAVVGSVNFGTDKNLGQNALDERDQLANVVNSHKVHSIKLTNLRPSSNYFFSIVSGQNTFLNNDEPFRVSTGQIIKDTPSSQLPITGSVILPDGTKPAEAIVYATVDGAQTISTLIKQGGNYTLPLNSLRTNDLFSYFSLNNNSNIKMLIVIGSFKSNVLLSKNQVSPIPTVTLSKDYDFTLSPQSLASTSAQLDSPGFPSVSVPPVSKNQTPQILTPKKDEAFPDQQPLFKGNALPNREVKIIIHSAENIETNVNANSSGSWSYRPSQPLSPGEHTLTIKTQDSSGIIKTITQSFTVYASGSQVSQSATPSGTLTPTSTPTPTVTLITTPTPTPTLTQILLTSTPTPTIILSQTNETLPPTGPSNILVSGIIGLGIILVGTILFLLTHGKITS